MDGLRNRLLRSVPVAGILVVDDNLSIRHLLGVLVETKTPFRVCGEAENGTEAIKMTKGLEPALVLLDFSMPGMNGIETAKVLRLIEPRPKIILFTLHADGVNKDLASAVGIDVVLSKADTIINLATHIKTLLTPK